MKRLKLTIILSIMLSMVIPFNCFAEVGATIGADLSVTGSYVIDPRIHDKYKDKFTAPTNFEYKTCGDVVVKYKVETNDGEKIGYNFYRIWTEQEYVGLYLGVTDDCRIGYNVVEILREGRKNQQSCLATDCYDGTFSVSRNINATSSSSSNFYALVGVNMNLAYYYDFEIVESDFPIFNNKDDATHYMNTGTVQNALYDTTTHYNGDDLYFKDFRLVPHVSTLFSNYYFDVYYELSDFALANIDTLNLRVDNDYRLSIRRADILNDEVYKNNSSISIPLKGKEKGFKLYLSDIKSISYVTSYYDFTEDDVLGHHGRSENVNTTDTVTYSNLYLRFYLRCNTSSGFMQSKRNDYNHDFLTNEGKSSIYVPSTDTSPNGSFNYNQEGDTVTSNSYYYHDASENKYYYVDNCKKTEITENEYNNNNYGGGSGGSSSAGGGAVANASIGNITVNVGGQGEYVSISPVDFNKFIKGFKDMLEELNVKGGLLSLLKDVFSIFPAEVSTIAVGAISAIVIVSTICILRR